jgi:hypothetical protein
MSEKIFKEKTPTNATTCFVCHKKIMKDSIRVVFVEPGRRWESKAYCHLSCYQSIREQLIKDAVDKYANI